MSKVDERLRIRFPGKQKLFSFSSPVSAPVQSYPAPGGSPCTIGPTVSDMRGHRKHCDPPRQS